MEINKYIVWKDWEVAHITEYDEDEDMFYIEEYYWENSSYYSAEFVIKESKPAKWYHIIKYYLKKLLWINL